MRVGPILCHFVALVAVYAVAAAPAATDAVRWERGATLGDVIERIAAAEREAYVLDPSVRKRAGEPAPVVFPDTVPVDAAVVVIEKLAGLEAWRSDGVTMWFGSGQRPSLLTARARLDRFARNANPNGDRSDTGTVELDRASVSETLRAMADAFEVAVACPVGLLGVRAETTLQADGIDLPTAAAIVAESLDATIWIGPGVVVFAGAGEAGRSHVERSAPAVDERAGDVDIQDTVAPAVGDNGEVSRDAGHD